MSATSLGLYVYLLSIISQFFTSCALERGDYLIHGLETLGISDTAFAGYMPFNGHDSGEYYFFLAKKRRKATSDLVVWLNGGPGCSSLAGMFLENGPMKCVFVDDDRDIPFECESNPYSWNEEADILYVEQPLNTGFSTANVNSTVPGDEKRLAKDFYAFLKSFVGVFTEYKQAQTPLTISGESYAGRYIPAIAAHMQQEGPPLPMKGVMIGNGAIDDAIFEASITTYAYTHGLITASVKEALDMYLIECHVAAFARGEPSKCHMLNEVRTRSRPSATLHLLP